jgi:hypothetical protein
MEAYWLRFGKNTKVTFIHNNANARSFWLQPMFGMDE